MASVNGILLLDKPYGLSSNAALQKVRRALSADKAGHSGTLDPMATGLLPIGLGQGTKALPYLLDAHKRYWAQVQLGSTTTTGDAEGEVLTRRALPALCVNRLESVLSAFRGSIQQVPPMYSALKQNGRPLYELARAGEVVERRARAVKIHSLDLLGFTDDCLWLQVWCSKGTYIRTLAEDIGERLGCGAHLTGLRRLGVAGFDPISESEAGDWPWCDWDAVQAGRAADYVLPVDIALRHLPSLTLEEGLIRRLHQGQRLSAVDVAQPVPEDHPVRLYDPQGGFYGLGVATAYQGLALERWMG